MVCYQSWQGGAVDKHPYLNVSLSLRWAEVQIVNQARHRKGALRADRLHFHLRISNCGSNITNDGQFSVTPPYRNHVIHKVSIHKTEEELFIIMQKTCVFKYVWQIIYVWVFFCQTKSILKQILLCVFEGQTSGAMLCLKKIRERQIQVYFFYKHWNSFENQQMFLLEQKCKSSSQKFIIFLIFGH